ncbi:MAG: hypothetical protein AAF721_32960 [Myxococcota bacterium]
MVPTRVLNIMHRLDVLRGFPVAVALALAPASVRASELGDAAAALAPGAWVVLDTDGYGPGLIDACDGVHTILEWANVGVWDPIRREVRYVGQGHYACRKHIRYLEFDNAWDELPEPPNEGIGHAYDHNAVDAATGVSFYRHYFSTTVARWDPTDGSWTSLPAVPASSVQVSGAITHFPEAGGLLFADSAAGLWLHSDGAWSQLTADLDVGPYNVWGSYNPQNGLALVGGGNGSTNAYLVAADGTVSLTSPTPIPFGTGAAAVVPDPATGNYLSFADDGTIYELDPTDLDGGWWNAGTHPVYDYANSWRVYVPISTHGVVMVLTENFDNSTVLLYRHAATAPPDRPDPPGDGSGETGDGGETGEDGNDGVDEDGGTDDDGAEVGDGVPGDGRGDGGHGDETSGPAASDGVVDDGVGLGDGDDDSTSGCSCHAAPDRGAGLAWLLVVAGAVRRRRARRQR